MQFLTVTSRDVKYQSQEFVLLHREVYHRDLKYACLPSEPDISLKISCKNVLGTKYIYICFKILLKKDLYLQIQRKQDRQRCPCRLRS